MFCERSLFSCYICSENSNTVIIHGSTIFIVKKILKLNCYHILWHKMPPKLLCLHFVVAQIKMDRRNCKNCEWPYVHTIVITGQLSCNKFCQRSLFSSFICYENSNIVIIHGSTTFVVKKISRTPIHLIGCYHPLDDITNPK